MVRHGARALAKSRNFLRAFLAVLSISVSARAGHAPLVPEPRTILLRENHPEHVVIGTRRGGYFATKDAGATWGWMCEAGIGYDDEEVYPGALLPNGTLVVSTGFGGISASQDGCSFSQWLPSALPFVADVRALPGDAGVLALEARSDGTNFVNQLWQSADGTNWRALGEPFASDVQATSFARSDAGDLYVGASSAAGTELLLSHDALSFERIIVSNEPGAALRVIGARGPSATARVFVVVDYAQTDGLMIRGDSALMSADGGHSFSSMLEATGDLSSWSLSNDGARLAVGGHNDGISVLEDAANAAAGTVLPRISARPVHALVWDGAGRLYAAGHEATDGFSVGVSDDVGRTFKPLFSLCQVQGPVACAPDTSIGSQCQSSGETGWDVRKEVASITACAPPGTTPASAGTPGNVAAVETTGIAGGTGVEMGAVSPVTALDDGPEQSASGSRVVGHVSCTFSRSANDQGWLLFLALFGAWLKWRAVRDRTARRGPRT